MMEFKRDAKRPYRSLDAISTTLALETKLDSLFVVI
jgi:hypothetical protein